MTIVDLVFTSYYVVKENTAIIPQINMHSTPIHVSSKWSCLKLCGIKHDCEAANYKAIKKEYALFAFKPVGTELIRDQDWDLFLQN